MTRLFVEIPEEFLSPGSTQDRISSEKPEITLSEPDSHYVRDVLRLTAASTLTLCTAHHSDVFTGEVIQLLPRVTVRLLSVSGAGERRNPVATLLFALTKGTKSDIVLEKACEMGVKSFIFWQAERSVVRIDSLKDRDKKVDRWDRLARAACQQSLQTSLPAVSLAHSLSEALQMLARQSLAGDTRVLCSLGAEARPLNRVLTRSSPASHIVIGPEGDFSDKELQQLHEAQFSPYSLGPYRLRSETAALTAIAMIQGIVGFDSPGQSPEIQGYG